MESIICSYCFSPIQENDIMISLEFSTEQIVHYHEKCHKAYCRKFKLIQKVCNQIMTSTTPNIVDVSKRKAVVPKSISTQADVNLVCPICMDKRADQLLQPCGHRLCSLCLQNWRRKSLTKNLPGTACCFCRLLIKEIVKV